MSQSINNSDGKGNCMERMDYVAAMRDIEKQLGFDRIIASPMILTRAMADLWLPEKDIEIMRIAMTSSCASTLLTQIRNMEGNEQDYQNQKAMLMNKAYLGEIPAHRVLVGLWAMAGKDAEQRGNRPEQHRSVSQIEIETERNEHIEIDKEPKNENNTKAQEHSEHGKKDGSAIVWGVIFAIAALGYFLLTNGGPMKDYRDVMLGKKAFISGDTGVKATINETYKCFEYDARRGYPQKFAVADVDQDGNEEVIIELSEEQFRLVLDKQSGSVYGYIFGFRSMKNIYTDGSFDWSSSADDSGFAYAHFDGMHCSVVDKDRDYAYKTEEKFYPFTENNIELYVK